MHVLGVLRKALSGSSVKPREFPGWWVEPEWWVGGGALPICCGAGGDRSRRLGFGPSSG